MKIKLRGVVSCAVTHTVITYYATMTVIGIFFVFSIFRAFVIIFFFFVCCVSCCITAQVAKVHRSLISIFPF